jgi:hypothetical protein
MNGETLTCKNSLEIQAGSSVTGGMNDNLATECRNLISVLSRKIETLCHECGEDADRVTYIRSLTASLTTLNSLLKSMEHERVYRSKRGFLEDARGFSYISVRYCDLERFSVK